MKRVRLILALAAGMLIIGSSVTAVAATTDTVQGTLAKLKIYVDGKQRALQNSPVVIKGTTYLPVREVAGLTGYNVQYDSKQARINLNSKEAGKLVNINDWVRVRELNKSHGVSIIFDNIHDKAIIKYSETEIEFPYHPIPDATMQIFKNDSGKELMILDGAVYIKKADAEDLIENQ